MSEQIGELIGILIRITGFIVISIFFFTRICGIESALQNIAETQNKIYLKCGKE